jgi:hypothetical protein
VAFVVVGDRRARVDGVRDRAVQLAAVGLSVRGRALAEVVERVPDQLIGDEQPQQIVVAVARERPEQRGSVGVGALVPEDVERVAPDLLVGDALRARAPRFELPGDGVQSPEQLACRCPAEPPQLARAQGRRVTRARALNRLILKRGG